MATDHFEFKVKAHSIQHSDASAPTEDTTSGIPVLAPADLQTIVLMPVQGGLQASAENQQYARDTPGGIVRFDMLSQQDAAFELRGEYLLYVVPVGRYVVTITPIAEVPS